MIREIRIATILSISLIQGCASINCFSFDGKAYSSCIGGKRYADKCKDHGGLDYHLGNIKGVCKDGTIYE